MSAYPNSNQTNTNKPTNSKQPQTNKLLFDWSSWYANAKSKPWRILPLLVQQQKRKLHNHQQLLIPTRQQQLQQQQTQPRLDYSQYLINIDKADLFCPEMLISMECSEHLSLCFVTLLLVLLSGDVSVSVVSEAVNNCQKASLIPFSRAVGNTQTVTVTGNTNIGQPSTDGPKSCFPSSYGRWANPSRFDVAFNWSMY